MLMARILTAAFVWFSAEIHSDLCFAKFCSAQHFRDGRILNLYAMHHSVLRAAEF